VNTRTLLEALGFQEDCEAISDQLPAYTYNFGNLELTASQVTNVWLVPVFLFLGIVRDARSIGWVEFQLPLDVGSFEQGVARIAYGIGPEFQPSIPTPWLADGRMWRDHLPWMRDMKGYESRPICLVEKDWFKVATKKLRGLAAAASESDLVWLAFDGEALRVSVCELTLLVPATGTPWNTRYAIKATELDHLPKRLTKLVELSIWDAKLTIGNRVWKLGDSDEKTSEPV
jgi:hypothetical protein